MPDAITVIRLPRETGSAIHQVMNALMRADPARCDDAHDDAGTPRQYAVALARTHLDVVTFRDAYARALMVGCGDARLVTRIKPDTLAADGTGERYLRLTFHSPTHFRVRGLDHVIPEAWCVFGSLAERWAALGYPALPTAPERRLPTLLDHYRVYRFAATPQPEMGFVGQARYDLLPCSADERRTLWTLARFGAWRGVGKHTSYGMGRMTVGTEARHVWERGATLDGRRGRVRDDVAAVPHGAGDRAPSAAD